MVDKLSSNAIGEVHRMQRFACGLAVAAATSLALPAATHAQSAAKDAAAQSQTNVDLKRRVESLEEQLVDMQVVVGTLESLAKSGGASSSPALRTPVSGAADAARIQTLESQLHELSAKVQQLTNEVHAAGLPQRASVANLSQPEPTPSFGTTMSEAPQPSFGSTTVTRGTDPIGGLIAGNADAATAPTGAAAGALAVPPETAPPAPPDETAIGATPEPVATAALLPPNVETGDPKQLYESAYGYLLQRDYGAAEVAFGEFLKRYPADSLASNAQYWLGETHFVRGQYKAAAGAFLKGYQSYATSAKAPDCLLKLAMSLDRLGQKDAACTSFAELVAKFPNAPQSVKARAKSERERVGCR